MLSSQLREQREWFERELTGCKVWESKYERVEKEKKVLETSVKEGKQREQGMRIDSEGMWKKLQGMEKELKRNEEERKKEKFDFLKQKKELENYLEQEKSITRNLTINLGDMKREIEDRRQETEGVKGEVEELKDQLNDLMAALTMRDKIEGDSQLRQELEGGTMGVVTQTPPTAGGEAALSPSQALAAKRKKKNKKK